MGFSTVILCGNVGKDPDLAYSGSGTAWLTARVAVTEWTGEKEETHWVTCVVFGKRAEHWAKRVQRGSAVTVQGRLAEEHSDDERYNGRLKVIVERFEVTRNWRTGDADSDSRGDQGREDDPRVGLEGDAPARDNRKGKGKGKPAPGRAARPNQEEPYQGGDGRRGRR